MFDWLADLISGVFNGLIAFLVAIVEWFLIFVGWILTGVFSLFVDFSIYLYDQLKIVIEYFANNIAFDAQFLNINQYLGGIPSEIQSTIASIGLVPAFAIIINAYLIRITLRAIPFFGSIFK